MADNNYTIPSEPLTREEEYLDAIVTNTASGGGGGKYVVDELTVTQNGTYTGTGGVNAYNPVTVNVPNSYTAEDEGKVVSSGELVAQTSRNITGAGTYDTTLNNSVTVSEPEPVQEKDVNFYDYDGTVLYSYTAQEFLALTEMPANPTHEGLTAQGWNWTLSQAQDYVTEYSYLNIGEVYIPSDGATKIYVNLTNDTLNPFLYIIGRISGYNVNGNITIDWGDGTIPTTTTGFTIKSGHNYASAGSYVISITVNNDTVVALGGLNNFWFTSYDGTAYAKNEQDYAKAITKIFIGSKMALGNYPIGNENTINVENITIPKDSIAQLGTNQTDYLGIGYMYNLKHLTLPYMTNINPYDYRLLNTLGNLHSFSAPYANTKQFTYHKLYTNNICYLTSYTPPDGITNFPQNSASKVTFPYLAHLVIPNTVTFLGQGVCFYFLSLETITIPNSVTSIGAEAFWNCNHMKTIKFKPTTPPTVANSNAWTGIPTDCIIYVPALVSNLYMTGTNYPNPSTYNYIGYATYTSGDTLPTLTTDETYTLTWYATVDDAIAQTNPITQGNGNEVYSRATPVT